MKTKFDFRVLCDIYAFVYFYQSHSNMLMHCTIKNGNNNIQYRLQHGLCADAIIVAQSCSLVHVIVNRRFGSEIFELHKIKNT